MVVQGRSVTGGNTNESREGGNCRMFVLETWAGGTGGGGRDFQAGRISLKQEFRKKIPQNKKVNITEAIKLLCTD
jgi:hypothetical protein